MCGHTGARTQDRGVISTSLYRLSYATERNNTRLYLSNVTTNSIRLTLFPVARALVVSVQVTHEALVLGALCVGVGASGLEGCDELVCGVFVVLGRKRREYGGREGSGGFGTEGTCGQLVAMVCECFCMLLLRVQAPRQQSDEYPEEHVVQCDVDIGHKNKDDAGLVCVGLH